MNSSQIIEKTSQNSIYDGFVMILDNVIEWASQIKSNDVFLRKRHILARSMTFLNRHITIRSLLSPTQAQYL